VGSDNSVPFGYRAHHPGGSKMIDHVYISVANVEKSLAFYAEALKPIG